MWYEVRWCAVDTREHATQDIIYGSIKVNAKTAEDAHERVWRNPPAESRDTEGFEITNVEPA